MKKYLLTAMLASASLAFGQPEGGHRNRPDLGLDPEQREQIVKLREDFQVEAIDLRADLQKLRLTLRQQMRVDNPNMRTINGTVDRIAAKQGVLAMLRIKQNIEARALLTPDQRRTFDARPFRHGRDRFQGRRFHGRQRGW